MRWLALPLFLAIATLGSAARADEGDYQPQPEPPVTSVEPFRAALSLNLTHATQAEKAMASIAKQPAPKSMKDAQRKLFDEQSAWLRISATRLHGVEVRMQQILAKGAGAPEIASINMEFVRMRDEIEMQSHRYDAAKARHAAALKALGG